MNFITVRLQYLSYVGQAAPSTFSRYSNVENEDRKLTFYLLRFVSEDRRLRYALIMLQVELSHTILLPTNQVNEKGGPYHILYQRTPVTPYSRSDMNRR